MVVRGPTVKESLSSLFVRPRARRVAAAAGSPRPPAPAAAARARRERPRGRRSRPPGALPAVHPPGAPFVAHRRLSDGDGHDGRIRWRYFQRYRWKYRQRKTVGQHLCWGRRPPARPSASDGRPCRGCRRCAGRSARRRARASDPRPVKMSAGALVCRQFTARFPRPAAGDDGRGDLCSHRTMRPRPTPCPRTSPGTAAGAARRGGANREVGKPRRS